MGKFAPDLIKLSPPYHRKLTQSSPKTTSYLQGQETTTFRPLSQCAREEKSEAPLINPEAAHLNEKVTELIVTTEHRKIGLTPLHVFAPFGQHQEEAHSSKPIHSQSAYLRM